MPTGASVPESCRARYFKYMKNLKVRLEGKGKENS